MLQKLVGGKKPQRQKCQYRLIQFYLNCIAFLTNGHDHKAAFTEI